MSLFISIPGYALPTKDGMHFVIKSLGIDMDIHQNQEASKTLHKATENALGLAIKSFHIAWYEPYKLHQLEGNIKPFNIESKDWNKFLTFILEKEPLIETKDKAKRAQKNSHLKTVTDEEILEFGYPELDDLE